MPYGLVTAMLLFAGIVFAFPQLSPLVLVLLTVSLGILAMLFDERHFRPHDDAQWEPWEYQDDD